MAFHIYKLGIYMAEFFWLLYRINQTKINTNPIILKTVFTCDLNDKDIKSNNNPVKLNFSDLLLPILCYLKSLLIFTL